MKSYIDIISRIFLGQYKDIEEGSNKISENNDKLIVWIVSLSTGSLAIILSSFNKIDFVSKESLRIVLVLFILTIIAGVIGRTLSAISSLIGYKLVSDFIFNLKTYEIPYVQRELEGNESAEMIYLYFKEDFQLELPLILETIKKLKNEELVQYNEQMRKTYLDFAKSRKKDFAVALKTMDRIMIDSFGYKEDHYNIKKNKSNRVKGVVMRTCTDVHLYFYGFSIFVFSSAIIMILINILCEFK